MQDIDEGTCQVWCL